MCSGCAHPTSNPLGTAATAAKALRPPVTKRSEEGNQGKQSSDKGLDIGDLANRDNENLRHGGAIRNTNNAEHVLLGNRDREQLYSDTADETKIDTKREVWRATAKRNRTIHSKNTTTGMTARDRQQTYLNTMRIATRKSELGRRSDTRPEILAPISSKDELLDYEEDKDFIEYGENPFLDPIPTEPEDPKKLISKIKFCGPEELQGQLRELCTEFSDLFSEHVRKEPARVPPMTLTVDEAQWFTQKNRGPLRSQTPLKSAEIEKQVTKMLELGVIEKCAASAYSQAHLVPKPEPNTWRFTIDYTNLNRVTSQPEGHPIPNVNEMLRRIGEKKPKFLGVMDFTSGYHQTPMDPKSMIYTAFMCFMGIFMWSRTVMGLKGAASYFQRVMATIVLAGLMYTKCELYIDDLLVFAQTIPVFLDNLRCVFIALRLYNIALNPKKCRFGMSSVEYVGHVIDEHGITFSEEKRGTVLNFPLPQRHKEMLQFLGLINYFRDHVHNITEDTKPLRDMVDMQKYKSSKKLEWTPELKERFYSVRDKVAACPKLYFPTPQGKVVVMTDASDFGIGCYIYETRDGDDKEYPLRFMSLALTGAQLRRNVLRFSIR